MTMNKMDLRIVPVGRTVAYREQALLVALSFNGCGGCLFKAELGAKFCEHRSSCFADKRPDKVSVRFIKVEK